MTDAGRQMRASGLPGTRTVLLAIALMSVAGALGCIRTPAKSPMMTRAENPQEMSAVQLRAQLHDFVRRFSLVVERSVDRIIAASDDAAARPPMPEPMTMASQESGPSKRLRGSPMPLTSPA